MLYLINTGQVRPTVLEKNKDADYHRQWARYCLGQANNWLQSEFMNKISKNKNFYKGDQWTDSEDVDSFLKDDTNQDRNRLSIVQNIIRPMVEQYRGNAIRMNLNFRVKSVSPQAKNRREAKYAEMMFYSKVLNKEDNPFSEVIKKNLPVGDTDAETASIFQNIYVDEFVKSMNNLTKFVSERNEFSQKQVRVAEEMALTGLAVIKNFEHAGHQEFKIIPSDTFFFDCSAREYDLHDAEFQGEIPEYTSSEIFEMYPDLTSEQREAIENYVKHFSGQSININGSTVVHNGKVPCPTVYWKDSQVDEFGYVRDEFGYEYFTKINYTYEGDEKPRYTDKDLIKSTSVKAKRLLGDKLKVRNYYDVLRTCTLIPNEIIASSKPNSKQENIPDIILEWGIAPYQETENQEYNSVKFPYKCYCWGYIDGEILSPIDDAIDPQRFINRIWSVAENQINNSRGSGTVYDRSMVDDESELLRDMNQSKPVGINAKGRGIQNAIGSYDGTVKGGTTVLFNIIDAMKTSVKETSGINDALKGESTGSDQLVGVTQLMIQRGSLMQEPFYNGMTNIFKQCFQAICSVGKRIYADSERNISIAVGDEGTEVIKISKDMRLEDFRCFVNRENPDEMLRSAADQMLLQLIGFPTGPLLDNKRFANLWGRSTPDEVANALRSYANEKEELARMSNKANQQQEAQLTVQAQQEQDQQQDQQHEMMAREDIKDLTDKKFEIKKEQLKALGKIAPKNKKAENLILNNAKDLQMNNI